MSSTIATLAGSTGLGSERQIIWAVNSANWWAFGYTGSNVLATWYSSDGVSWTAGATHTLSNAHSSEGRNLAVAYKNISGIDVVHIALPWTIPNTVAVNGIRATISGTALTFHSIETAIKSGTTDGDALNWSGSGVEFDSNNKIHLANGFAGGGNGDVNSSDSTADAGSSEQMTPVTWTGHVIDSSISKECRSYYVISRGSGNAGLINDDGSGASTTTGLDWHTWNGSAWNVDNTNNKVSGGAITAIDKNDWGAVAASASDVHVVYRSASGSLVHRRFNGTSWGAGQTIPSQTSLAGGGVALTSDGSNVWLCIIDTDSANTIRFLRWSPASVNGIADTWDSSWQVVESTTQTRTWIGCARDVQTQTALVYWSEGSSFQAATFIAVPPVDPAGAWIQSNQGSTGTTASTFPVTFTTQNVVAGNRIVVAVAAWNGTPTTVTSVTDSALNAYAKDKDAVESDGTHISIWSAPITAGGGTKPTVTAHASATTNEWAMWVHEYSGLLGGTSGYLDGTSALTTTTAASPILSGASTPVPGSANEIAFGFYGDGGNNITTIGVSVGWNQRGTSIQATSSTAEGACSDQLTTAGVGSNASFTLSSGGSPAGVLVVVYKLAASAIGLTGSDPSLNPWTLPGGDLAQMLWAQPAVLAGAPAVTVIWIPQGARRRAYASYRRQRLVLPSAGPLMGQDVPQQRPRARARPGALARRHPPDIPWYQAAPAQPSFVVPPVRRRSLLAWTRRGRGNVPVSAGESPIQPGPRMRPKLLPRRPRRAWEPTWFQAPLPPIVGELWRRRRIIFAWLMRRSSPVVSQTLPQLVEGSLPIARRRLWQIVFRRARQVSSPSAIGDGLFQAQRPRLRVVVLRRLRAVQQPFLVAVVNPPIVDLVRRRVLQRFWSKPPRGRAIEPSWGQATAAANPSIVDLVRRRVLQRFWTRSPRGRAIEPPWGQAVATANPTFVDWVRRRALQRFWAKPPRGRPVEPPWGQAAANTNQPYYVATARLRRLWGAVRRSRPMSPLPVADGVAQLASGRRRLWWPWRRSRAVVIVSDQAGVLTLQPSGHRPLVGSRRRRSAWVPTLVIVPVFVDWVRRRLQLRMWPRQPRARRSEPGWGQSVNPVPLQPIVMTIITRSMGLLLATRDMTGIVVTRSLSVVLRVRDMAIGIITRSESSRPNTRG